MCPCDPNDNTLNPNNVKPPFITGDGLAIGPIDLTPDLDFEIPFNLPEDLVALMQKFSALFPSYQYKPNVDDTTKTPLQAIMNILSQITPFLALWKFFLALLNMVVCIIEVLCGLIMGAIPKLKKLFKQCLPAFLSLFPWLALILMIISLILLLIAIIEYIIMMIIKFIKDIIKNFKRLAKAISDQDTSSILAVAQKISDIMCLIQGFLAVLIALEAIWSIIKDLAAIGGAIPCEDCCGPDSCPDFIKFNKDGITGAAGKLLYYKAYEVDLEVIKINLRPESWQFYDSSTGRAYNIKDIIYPEYVFWPEDTSFGPDSNQRKVPYTIDMKMHISNPSYWNPADSKGPRNFVFKDVYFSERPSMTLFQNNSSNPTPFVNGTAQLVGGLVFEEDGSPYMLPDGTQAKLNTFIHKEAEDIFPPFGAVPSYDDGYYFTDIEYTWKPNIQALVEYTLVTAGCAVTDERVINQAIYSDLASVITKVQLPDINNAYNCLAIAIDKFRKNMSEDTALIFQADCELCLNNLRDEAFNAYKQAVDAGFNPFTSTASLDTNLQFVSLPIKVKVTLKDISSNPINLAIPDYQTVGDIAKEIAGKIVATPSLGKIDNFVYDGYDSFVANLTSDSPGEGTILFSYKDNTFKNVLNRDNLDIPTSIENNILSYTFVGGIKDIEPKPQRDVGDIARDSFNNIG